MNSTKFITELRQLSAFGCKRIKNTNNAMAAIALFYAGYVFQGLARLSFTELRSADC
jgi:hypothetical protein